MILEFDYVGRKVNREVVIPIPNTYAVCMTRNLINIMVK